MNTVVSLATPGLGNRIKTYVSSLSKYDNVKTCRESDSFLFESIQKASANDVLVYPTVDGWRLDVSPNEEMYIEEYKSIDFLYEKTPPYFVEKYLKIFFDLKINQEIIERVNQFSKDWKNVIGLHVRSWYCQRNNWHNINIFEEQLGRLDPDRKIFLCTDNSNVSNYFTFKYGDRIIKYPQILYDDIKKAESGYNHNLIDNINALTDMLLLARCPDIIGTFASSFTECSWWFSGCKSNVIIPVPKNVPESFLNEIFLKK